MLLISFAWQDHIPLQASCQLSAGRLAQLGESISRSIYFDIHIDLLYLTDYVSVLPLLFNVPQASSGP
jgi:hypothetical protein